MRVAVISDVHCAGLDDPVQLRFVAWLDALDAGALWVLGDLFHWGWVIRGGLQPEFAPVVTALTRLVGRGVPVLFVPGNHDFSVARFMADVVGAEVRGPHARVLDGHRVFVAHGDEADRSFGYWCLRALLRGWLFDRLIQALGVRLGTRLLCKLAGADRFSVGSAGPAQEWLLTQAGADVDLAICGHFHAPSILRVNQLQLVTMGCGDAVLWLEDGRLAR